MRPTDVTPPPQPLTRDEAIREALEAIAANDLDRAIEFAQQVNALDPNSNVSLHLVGLISLKLNEPGKAVEAFEAAARLAPDVREHPEALATVFAKTGRLVDALFQAKLAAATMRDTGIPGMLPDWLGTFDEAFYKIGDQPLIKQGQKLLDDGNWPGAAEAFRREVEVDPRSVEGWRGFTTALYRAQRFGDALVASRALVSLSDDRAADLSLHGLVLAATGRFDEALVAGREAESHAPDDAAIAWRTVQAQGRRPDADPVSIAALAERWGERFAGAGIRPDPAPASEFATRRVRLGVMSGHWAHGDGLDLLVPIIEQLDRRGVELFVYADGLIDAPLARRLRARSNTWQDLSDLDAETASFVVCNDRLDVLIDLDDPFRSNHVPVIAQAPAPFVLAVQGDPAVALAAGFTGVIGDGAAYAGRDDAGIVRVEGGLICQPVDLPPLDPAAVRPVGSPVTFGTVAAGWQIGEATLAAWTDILASVPGSRLLLDLAQLGDDQAARRIVAALPADRVVLQEPGLAQAYLAAVDLLLAPLGDLYGDGLVAAAAQGTPGLACRGRNPRSHWVAGWLERAGLADLVAGDPEDYRRKAIAAVTTAGFRADFADRLAADREQAPAEQARRLLKALAVLVNSTSQP